VIATVTFTMHFFVLGSTVRDRRVSFFVALHCSSFVTQLFRCCSLLLSFRLRIKLAWKLWFLVHFPFKPRFALFGLLCHNSRISLPLPPFDVHLTRVCRIVLPPSILSTDHPPPFYPPSLECPTSTALRHFYDLCPLKPDELCAPLSYQIFDIACLLFVALVLSSFESSLSTVMALVPLFLLRTRSLTAKSSSTVCSPHLQSHPFPSTFSFFVSLSLFRSLFLWLFVFLSSSSRQTAFTFAALFAFSASLTQSTLHLEYSPCSASLTISILMRTLNPFARFIFASTTQPLPLKFNLNYYTNNSPLTHLFHACQH
jgi:hypothetical protein